MTAIPDSLCSHRLHAESSRCLRGDLSVIFTDSPNSQHIGGLKNWIVDLAARSVGVSDLKSPWD